MKNLIAILLLICPLLPFADDTLTFIDKSPFKLNIHQVENSRENNGSRITDESNILVESIRFQIDSLLKTTEDSTGHQLSVVCLDSIGNNDPHDFGLDLFNLWGIGDQQKDNGLLILLVMDIHRVEFITGRGMETILTDADSYKIQQESMIPEFKNNNYSLGMLKGVEAVIDVINNIPPAYLIEEEIIESEDTYESDYIYHQSKFDYLFDHYFIVIFLLAISTILAVIPAIIFIVMLIIALANTPDPYKKYKRIYLADHWLLPLLFPIPFLLFFILIKILKNRWRKQVEGDRYLPKISKNGLLMKLLTFEEQDVALSKKIIQKDVVKSDRYDIWATEDYTEALVFKYDRTWQVKRDTISHGKLYYKFVQCPECLFKTAEKINSIETKIDSQYYNLKTIYKCQNCEKESTDVVKLKYYFPSRSSTAGSKKSKSIFSSSRRNSSSSSSRTKKSSSSRSGGGSSYGGGSSGGGGAGSSW